MTERVQFMLNGSSAQVRVDSERMLLWVLRTDLGMTGTKYGCGEGYCGACTVVINGEAARSCQVPVKDVRGKEVVTIEGLGRANRLHPLQAAFMEQDALQCGYCTPGMIMNAYALLRRNPRPSPADIIAGMDGSLCRCGAYDRIVRAIQATAKTLTGGA